MEAYAEREPPSASLPLRLIWTISPRVSRCGGGLAGTTGSEAGTISFTLRTCSSLLANMRLGVIFPVSILRMREAFSPTLLPKSSWLRPRRSRARRTLRPRSSTSSRDSHSSRLGGRVFLLLGIGAGLGFTLHLNGGVGGAGGLGVQVDEASLAHSLHTVSLAPSMMTWWGLP